MNRTRGFTLIELLVVLSIIGLLTALMFPAVSKALAAARKTAEVSCARSLLLGVFNYANEHGGEIIPGYLNRPVTGPDGDVLPFPASARYPWRLMPYIGSTDKRVMWANPSGRFESMANSSSDAYAVSVSPSLGMNVFYVGGDDSGTSGQGIRPTEAHYTRFGKFCITRIDEAVNPSLQIVFASARMIGEQNREVPGYYMIQAPRVVKHIWSAKAFDPNLPPGAFGHVDLRYDRRAVVGMLDGHVELLGETELRDMRRWSNLAALADDPDYGL